MPFNKGSCPFPRVNNSNSQSTSVILIKIFPITPVIISSKLGTNIKASLDLFGVFHPTLQFFTQMETSLVEKNLFVQIKNQTLLQSKIVKIHQKLLNKWANYTNLGILDEGSYLNEEPSLYYREIMILWIFPFFNHANLFIALLKIVVCFNLFLRWAMWPMSLSFFLFETIQLAGSMKDLH